ncbi:hypothetical protein GCM10007320_08710 [Pseudorhodoferax aquiterrae]|uniref:Uncharacterized protein n=1 Tax=Pseudorhodoferax aquiterrae TaxID=747304 RepID=A0ABQ3FWZ4_9BURK|nr:hypothetical protein [Pseudorhodoferax aquiterrae]GHC72675.1 hypothetical protein GCM10007320_08710 [Pseudorhodoferax aquiterrae]
MTISEEHLRGLSAVEREALLAADENDEDLVRELGTGGGEPEVAPAPAPAPAAAPAATDDPDEEADPPAAAPASAAEPAPAEPPAAAPAPEQAPAPAPAQPEPDDEPIPAPQPQRSTPDDVADQRKALRAEKSGAMSKLLAGEITQEEYQAVEDRVQDALDGLVRAEASDQARDQMRMDSMIGDYNKELRTAQRGLASAGLDLKANDGAIQAEFDRAIRMFAGEAGARGLSDRPGDLAASREALKEASEYVLRRHGKTAAAPAAVLAPATPPASAPAAQTKPRAPVDRSTLPPTLASVPVAADATISNEFAHLENLDGAELERALARLTPDQQERYLA